MDTNVISQASTKASTDVIQLGMSHLDDLLSLSGFYQAPHNIFGGPSAHEYLSNLLSAKKNDSFQGWHGIADENGKVTSALHISIYGHGDGSHTLWKIRHPLTASFKNEHLHRLLEHVFIGIRKYKSGSHKIVSFVTQREFELIKFYEKNNLALEAEFADYYRINETCYVYGVTLC